MIAKRKLLASLGACALASLLWQAQPARADGTAQPVTACGAVTYQANGLPMPQTMTPDGLLCTRGSVGGFELQASVIPAVQTAAYAGGQAIGGLQAISIGSTNGLSGILTQIQVASKGGSTVGVVAYVWSKSPASTTCTDKANFVVNQTDNQFLVVPPQLITPALAVSAQDATTYGSSANLVGNFNNGSTNTNLYVCVLAAAAVTPATTTDYRFTVQGIKDQQ